MSNNGAAAGSRLSWYAVQTRSNFEKRVAGDVSAKGMESYLPVVNERRQWKDRKKDIEEPLFRGYLFVRFSGSAAEQLDVLKVAGAARVLGLAGRPEAIPDREVEALRIAVNSGLPLARQALPHEGDRVYVRSGPLKGASGILVTAKNTRRLVVSIHLLSQSVAAELDTDDVEAIRPPAANRK
jgi:transcription antitermination factor NusG